MDADGAAGRVVPHEGFAWVMARWQIVLVGELGKRLFAAFFPRQAVVVGDVDGVVGVDDAEGSEAVADYGEERDENVVDYVDYIDLFAADIDPTWGGCQVNMECPRSLEIRLGEVVTYQLGREPRQDQIA